MKTIASSALVVCAFACTASMAAAQTPVGALAVDERQGDQWGWAVDYETAGAAQQRALSECGPNCSVVLTFARCAAYAADQDVNSTAVGWAESYGLASEAQQAALTECSSRGGSGCIVRVWGCNGPVVEEGLSLEAPARRQIQEALGMAGFDPGGADGMFGPRTRAAIRGWQSSRGARATGYLDAASAAALRSAAPGPAVARPSAPAAQQPPASSEVELVFWQSIANSTDPADFEAYLAQFPNGVFRALAQNRLSALGASGAAARSGVGGAGSPALGSRPPDAGVDARGRPGSVFRPNQPCAPQPSGACWMEISGRSECYVWNPNPQPNETVTWTGECAGGLAQGTGTITWVVPAGGGQTNTGRLQDGRNTGHWVIRFADGTVAEGPMVNGGPHGNWVIRDADGDTEVRRFENGRFVEVVEPQ